MQLARVKNWASFQHYKNRNPPWIKLHRSILDNYEFACLPLASKALAPLLWLLAAESQDATFRSDSDWLAFRLHIDKEDVDAGLKPLFDAGFIENASKPIARRKRVATPEAETETEREKDLDHRSDDRATAENDFDTKFWPAYPRKVGKANAEKAWRKLHPDPETVKDIVAAIAVQRESDQWCRDGGQFIPHPATWLNGKRWRDDVSQNAGAPDVARLAI
ncbi:MAG TPA: hypothetical protein VFW94_02960 [Candidatus Acidoferrales bacterium]|nr:hypothetical protein [Candidatus Acidoferrales bacterium]